MSSSLPFSATMPSYASPMGMTDRLGRTQFEGSREYVKTIFQSHKKTPKYKDEARRQRVANVIEQTKCPRCMHVAMELRVDRRLKVMDEVKADKSEAKMHSNNHHDHSLNSLDKDKLPLVANSQRTWDGPIINRVDKCHQLPGSLNGQAGEWRCSYFLDDKPFQDNPKSLLQNILHEKLVQDLLKSKEKMLEVDEAAIERVPIGSTDWMVVRGDIYFYNAKTGQKTFDRPPETFPPAASASPPSSRGSSPTNLRASPKNGSGKKGNKSKTKTSSDI